MLSENSGKGFSPSRIIIENEILKKMLVFLIIWKKDLNDYKCSYVNKIHKKIEIGMNLIEYVKKNEISYYNKYLEVINNKKTEIVEDRDKRIDIIYVDDTIFYEMQFNKDRHNILNAISKKIRDPLTNIVGIINIADQSDNVLKKNNIDIIKKSCHDLMMVSNGIVDLINLFSECPRLTKEYVNLENNLKKINKTILEKIELSGKKINFSILYDEKIPKFLYVNIKSVDKVLEKMMDNSIRFTKKGSIALEVMLFTNIVHKNTECPFIYLKNSKKVSLVFKIKDSGSGMSSRKIKTLNNVLGIKKNEDELASDSKFLGIGLTISKLIVSQFGGNIWFNSNEDFGTIFYFNISCKSAI